VVDKLLMVMAKGYSSAGT